MIVLYDILKIESGVSKARMLVAAHSSEEAIGLAQGKSKKGVFKIEATYSTVKPVLLKTELLTDELASAYGGKSDESKQHS